MYFNVTMQKLNLHNFSLHIATNLNETMSCQISMYHKKYPQLFEISYSTPPFPN